MGIEVEVGGAGMVGYHAFEGLRLKRWCCSVIIVDIAGYPEYSRAGIKRSDDVQYY